MRIFTTNDKNHRSHLSWMSEEGRNEKCCSCTIITVSSYDGCGLASGNRALSWDVAEPGPLYRDIYWVSTEPLSLSPNCHDPTSFVLGCVPVMHPESWWSPANGDFEVFLIVLASQDFVWFCYLRKSHTLFTFLIHAKDISSINDDRLCGGLV